MTRATCAALAAALCAAACSDGDPGSLAPPESGGQTSTVGARGPATADAGSRAVADSSSTTPPGVNSPDAKTFFVQSVYPMLMQACGNCHAPPGGSGAPVYLAANGGAAYTSIEARGYIAPTSMLLRKGSHEGPAFTSAQTTLVSQWLDLEARVRGNQAPVDLLSKLGDCLDQTKFDAIGLEQLRTIKRPNENANNCTGCNQAPCQSCHQQGEYAMHSNFSQLGTKTFAALQQNGTSPEGIYLISKYITTNGTQLVPSTAIADKATSTSTGSPYSHPMFQISAATAAAIQAFAADAIAKHDAKQCGK